MLKRAMPNRYVAACVAVAVGLKGRMRVRNRERAIVVTWVFGVIRNGRTGLAEGSDTSDFWSYDGEIRFVS